MPETRELLSASEFPFTLSEVKIFDELKLYEGLLSNDQARDLLRADPDADYVYLTASGGQEHDSLQLADIYELELDAYDLELIGSDRMTIRMLTAVLRRWVSSHGVAVAHLLAGKYPISPGVSSKGQIALLSDAELLDSVFRRHLQIPGVVNVSKKIHTGNSADYYLATAHKHRSKRAAPPKKDDLLHSIGDKTLFVVAACNEFPDKSPNVNIASRARAETGKSKIIPVGAIYSDGALAQSSVAARAVVVTAPGRSLYAFDGKRNTLFGGTSAAAPIVSGVLADVRSILPHLTSNNAVQLLEQTAIKTATNEVSEFNGAGVVNHYKMIRVALRLAAAGYDGEVIPDNLNTFLDFSTEVDDLLAEGGEKTALAAFRNLRRAFFLAPDDGEIRTQLADAYRRMELQTQAAFYDSPAVAIEEPEIKKKLYMRALLLRNKLFDLEDTRLINHVIESAPDLPPVADFQHVSRLREDDLHQLQERIETERDVIEKRLATER